MKQDDKLWQLEIVKTFFGFVENEHQINKQYGLSQLLDNFKKMNAFGISLDLERVVQNSDGVNLITAHSSKGLEFETVYIIKADSKSWEERKANQSSNIAGLKELLVEMGIAPEEKDMEEERRLFYVAITRAKQNLYISYPLMKLKDSSTQESTAQNSIFVSELELPKVHVETSEAELCDFLLKSLEKVSHPIGVEQHQKIKTYLEKFELSASALNKYLNCPVTFYYETVLNIPQARSEYAGFGSAIHYAFQKFFEAYRSHETKEKPSLDYFLKQFKIGMMKEEVNFPKDTLDDRIKYGSNLLKEYYEQFSDNWPVDTLTEYKINTHTPKGTPIKGNIDRLDITQVGTSKEVTIIDYKTGSVKNLKKKSASPTETNPLGSDYWRQMQFYKVLVEFDKKQTWQSNQGKFLPILKADNDKFQEFIEINFNPLHTDLIINLMDETYQKIMNQEFEIGCGKTECRWCNFQKQLQV
jgi:DNA helicase-2/ATP-dependent DNA helicase PcrA